MAQPQEAPATGAPIAKATSPALRSAMRGHDARGAAIRDAVARAELGVARREAQGLATLRADTADPAWREPLEAMRAAAERLSQAADVRAAGRELAAIGRTCGECHAKLGGPRPMVAPLPEEAPGFVPRMKRHEWAIARMWDGLIVPSDAAWKVGAGVLADAPLEPALSDESVATLAASVHALAGKARNLGAGEDRTLVYGELIITCATCHAQRPR